MKNKTNINTDFLAKTALFSNIPSNEISELLSSFAVYEKSYIKDEFVLRRGEHTEALALVLSGSVNIENEDVWGNRSILNHISSGEIFAETYACLPELALRVSVVASEASHILFLNITQILQSKQDSLALRTFILNLLKLAAEKNLQLSQRVLHSSAKTIRARLSAYLSTESSLHGQDDFYIPYNRQELADYLSVDRSALSSELSKMQREGLIKFSKNHFQVLKTF